jgi:DNA replication protein DnaC
MNNTEVIGPELKTVLRRLKLSRILDTLPERLTTARTQQMPHQDLLLLVLSDEATRRDSLAATFRAERANLDRTMQFELWDKTAKVTYDGALLNELVSLRFIEAHAHVAILGPCGVGKTFIAHALGHVACRRGFSVIAVRGDQMLKTLKDARLDNTHDAELCKLIGADLLIIDDFGLDAMDAGESRDAYEIFTERHRAGSMIITSNRGPDEWLATFADPMRAQSAIDRFTGNSYDLVIEGESYRPRQKPRLAASSQETEEPTTPRRRARARKTGRRRAN